ncbi:MAG: sulfatase-like hydrolase/transferase [Myxococcota bacterium]
MWWTIAACTHAPAPPDAPLPPDPTATSTGTATSTPGDPGPLVFSDGRVPRNLLIVSVDTTRRDRVGAWSGLPTTPFLDARLAEGVRLDDHRTCSNWTAPSMLCATTGHDPRDLGFWPSTWDPEVADIPDDLPTLARSLADAGFETTLVTGNPVFSRDFDTAQGFGTVILRDFAPADEIADRAIAQVDALQATGAPWLLHVHFMDPHREYCPPDAYRAGLDALPDIGFDLCTQLNAALAVRDDHDDAWQGALLDRLHVLYDGELRYFDDTLGRLWAAADDRGALDDTLVVWMTDHGEQQLERGVVDHGFDLFAEENRAGAGFWAKTLAPGAWSGPTLHQDLAVTLEALYGRPIPPTATGIPLGQAPADRVRSVFAYSVPDYGVPQLAVIAGDRALHYAWDGVRAFHRLDVDPAERADAYDPADPEVVALWAALDPEVQRVEALWPHLPPPVDPRP